MKKIINFFFNHSQNDDYENTVKKLYQKILLREPDEIGLKHFTSELRNKKLTVPELSNLLENSSEGLSIKRFSHYSDKYWNDIPLVQKYKNRLCTNDENIHWIDDIKSRFQEHIPFEKTLVVGCGNGWLERRLIDIGITNNVDAFDISEKYIAEAKTKKDNRNINYFIDDINDLQNIGIKKYDAVFNFAILHHAENIEDAMQKLASSLKSSGLIFNEEYVGPARNQYDDTHLELMSEVMSSLPEKFRSKYPLRPPLENFRVEPSEAVRSDLIIPAFGKYFDIIYERNVNGGIAYQILWNNIENFHNQQDPEAKKWLEYIIKKDEEQSTEKKVPILFWYVVGKPKSL